MAWSDPPTKVPGNLIIAADWNTYVRDNFNVSTPALVTTAGDIVYATGVNTLSRFGIGTSYQPLRVNSGATAFEYGSTPPSSLVYQAGTAQSFTRNSTFLLTFDTTDFNNDNMASLGTHNERLNANTAGIYIVGANTSVSAVSNPTSFGTDYVMALFFNLVNGNGTLFAQYGVVSKTMRGGFDGYLNTAAIISMTASQHVSAAAYVNSTPGTGAGTTLNGTSRIYRALFAAMIAS